MAGCILAIAAKAAIALGSWDEADEFLRLGLARRPVGQAGVRLQIQRCRLDTFRGDLGAAARARGRAAAGDGRGGSRIVPPLLAAARGSGRCRRRVTDARATVEEGFALAVAGLPDPALATTRGDRARLEADLAAPPGHGATMRAADAGPGRRDRRRGRADRRDPRRRSAPSRPRSGPTRDRRWPLSAGPRSRVSTNGTPRGLGRGRCRVRRDRAPVSGGLRPLPAGGSDPPRPWLARGGGNDPGAARTTAGASGAPAARRGRQARPPGTARRGRPPADGPSCSRARRPRPRSTDRERSRCSSLIAAGWSNQQIADALFISRKTASVHASHIFDKLGAANRIDAAAIALARPGLGPAATRLGGPRRARPRARGP